MKGGRAFSFAYIMTCSVALVLACLPEADPEAGTSVEPAPATSVETSPDDSDTIGGVEVEIPFAQAQATASAESYLAFTHFSRDGLVGQLEFEGFSREDAEAAIDSLDVDWNVQAAGKAEDYLGTSAFSREGLLEQLVFEGFTPEQAEHGVAAVGY